MSYKIIKVIGFSFLFLQRGEQAIGHKTPSQTSLSLVHVPNVYPDIFVSATFLLRIRFLSVRIRRSSAAYPETIEFALQGRNFVSTNHWDTCGQSANTKICLSDRLCNKLGVNVAVLISSVSVPVETHQYQQKRRISTQSSTTKERYFAANLGIYFMPVCHITAFHIYSLPNK